MMKPDEKLSLLVDGIVKSVQTETKCERADQIRNAIEFHIQAWLNEVESLNPLFKVSELIQVGSYAEGTKILQPDEFDFLAVIDDLSKPGSVNIDKSASNLQSNLVRVEIADEKLKTNWDKLCKNGHLKCFKSILFPGIGKGRFGHVFISVLWEVVRKGPRLRPTAGSPTDIACKIQLNTIDTISLFLEGAEYKTPNVLIKFLLEDREITVDLSPAIRYHKIEDCFKAEDCAGPSFAELVLSRKSLLLIATDLYDYDFKVTVTESEVRYMQSVMKQEHKVIYIFLKYLEKLYERHHVFSVASFTSYMLKTVCIHHDIKCKTDKRTFMECLKSVIEDLDVCTRQEYVKSVVNRHTHLYPNYLLKMVNEKRMCILDTLRKVCQLPDQINTVKDFDAFLVFLIHEQTSRREEEQRQHLLRQQESDRLNSANTDTTNSQSSLIGTEEGQCVKHLDGEAVSQIIFDMGFEPEQVRKAMRECQNDPDKAVEYLLTGSPERLDTELTSNQTSSGVHDLVTVGTDRNEEFSQNASNGQDMFTSEILYQRQKDL